MDQKLIEAAYQNRDLLKDAAHKQAVFDTLAALDQGKVRVASPLDNGEWQVNAWVKQAILMYFGLTQMEELKAGPMVYHDKIPLKSNYVEQKVRVVPPAVARYGSFLEPGVIMMPCYVNIGAYVSTGTMVDTWATVGSCAQIGKGVHLSGGVGIGGVLEPPQGAPVIIEDGAFLGSRAIVVEGVRVRKRAVLGAGVVITASTKIVDVTGPNEVITRGEVPENAVVIPGSIPKKFASGTYGTPCALIIGRRSEKTDEKTSLNDALRDLDVAV